MTQSLIKVKPLRCITNERGQKCYQFEDYGQLAEVLMAPFQIGRALPSEIKLVKQLNPDGSVSYNQSKYELLRELYGVEGQVTLTLQSITKEENMSMYKLYLKDSYALVHVYLCRTSGDKLMRGCRLNFQYQLIRSDDVDGYLALTCLDPLEDEGFLDPDRFIESCHHAATIRSCYERFKETRPETNYQKMATQIQNQSNLWVMTFINHLKQKMNQYSKSNRYTRLAEYATAYESIERRILADDSYIGAFKTEKREDMRNRIEFEIINAWAIRTAIALRQHDSVDRYMAYVQERVRQDQPLNTKQTRLLVDLLNLDETLIDRYVNAVTQLLYNNKRRNGQPKGSMLCLHSIVDNYINHRITEINMELHIKDNPAQESVFVHVIQLVGIQIMLLDADTSYAVVRLKTAQLCRLISYLLDDAKATLMVKKAIALLSANIHPQLSLSDFLEDSINELAEKLLAIPTTPVEEPLQFLGAGSVVFYQGKIYITSQQQCVSHASRNEGTVLHNLLDGLINLRTQNDPTTLQGRFGLLEEGWHKLYEPVRSEQPHGSCPLTPGVYPICFNHINKEKAGRAIFYVKDEQGNAYKAMMYPNGLYSVPCDTMANVFQFGDKFYANVIKVVQDTAVVSIVQNMYSYCNQRVSTGDRFLAKCLEIQGNEAILYGDNGALCKAPVDKIKVNRFYIVSVSEMPPKQAKYIPVRMIKPSGCCFDPLTVNREQIRHYINTHNADTGERVARIYATELMYLLDRMALLTKDIQTKFFYYQYLKLTSCIVRTKMSYIYEALCALIKERIEHPGAPTHSVTAEDLKTYPRLAGEMQQ